MNVPNEMTKTRKVIEVVFTFWLVFITIRYGATVLKSVATPFTPGMDPEWLAFWLIATAVMGLALILWSNALKIIGVLALAALIAIAVLSGVWLSALLSLWIMLVSYSWGLCILQAARAEPGELLESIAIAVPLGLIVPAGIGFLLASVHLLTVAALWGVLGGLTVLRLRTILNLSKKSFGTGESGLDRAFPLLLVLPVLILNFVWAVAPEVHFDANNYHLAVPKIYLANGGFINQPYFLHSYFTRFVEMIFAFGLALGGQASAKILSFILSVVAGCCVFSLGKETFSARTGYWAAAFFYLTPVVSWLAGTTYIDNIVALFVAATVLAIVKWSKEPGSAGWMCISGLLAGVALASKVNAAFGLAFPVAMICWKLRRTAIRRAGIFLLLVAAAALPWYGLIYHWTGNPVIPMLNGVFKSPMLEQENRIMNSNDFGVGVSPGSLIRLPFRFVFNTERFGEASPRGSAGIALLVAFPFSVFLLSKERRTTGLLLGGLAVYFIVWSFTFQYARYFVHILPLVCVLAVATTFEFASKGVAARVCEVCLAVGLILQFLPTPVQFWNIPERFPVRVAAGLETREHFLDRALIGFTAANRLNGILKPQDRVIGAGVEQVRFYLNAPLETLAESTLHSKLREVAGIPPDETLLKNLRNYGFSYILVTRDALRMPADYYPYLQPQFLSRYTKTQFMDPSAVVYRLNVPEP